MESNSTNNWFSNFHNKVFKSCISLRGWLVKHTKCTQTKQDEHNTNGFCLNSFIILQHTNGKCGSKLHFKIDQTNQMEWDLLNKELNTGTNSRLYIHSISNSKTVFRCKTTIRKTQKKLVLLEKWQRNPKQLLVCMPKGFPVIYNSSFWCPSSSTGLVLSVLSLLLRSFSKTSSKGGSPGLRKTWSPILISYASGWFNTNSLSWRHSRYISTKRYVRGLELGNVEF